MLFDNKESTKTREKGIMGLTVKTLERMKGAMNQTEGKTPLTTACPEGR